MALLAVLAAWLAVPTARADTISLEGSGGAISFDGRGGHPADHSPGPQGTQGNGNGPPGTSVPNPLTAYLPTLMATAAGGSCITVLTQSFPTAAGAASINRNYSTGWSILLRHYIPCPGVAVPVPPSAVAASWWQVHGVDLLSRPRPSIAPGYALSGKLAYLETGAQIDQDFSNQTPLGTLAIAATGRLYVDWGDGTGWQGPYSTAGGPWPLGTITHTWDSPGPYTVTVQERWSATWALGGSTGSLSSLATVGAIPAFEVRELESVRNR